MQEPDFFSWLLAQNKSNIHVFAGDSTVCPESGKTTELSFSEGFFAYQWEYNGKLIADSTRHTFVARQPGIYRGRFSRVPNPGPDDWNQWSKPVEIRSVTPGKPEITWEGTRFLPDLNGKNEITLSTAEPYALYHWKRNGEPVSLPGKEGLFTLKPQQGSGSWTVLTEQVQGCPGPTSEPVRIFFSNEAPAILPPPTNLTGKAISDNTVRLTWKDRAEAETGCEIWRRSQTTNGFEPWKLVTITNANANTFDDANLTPGKIFQYKIRAIGETVRSEYTPLSDALAVHLIDDTQAPSTPVDLTADHSPIGTLNLRWSPANDNTGVLEYVIQVGDSTLHTGSEAPRYTLTDVALNRTYTLSVRARDRAGNVSAPCIAVRVNTYVSGLYYTHGRGNYTSLGQIDWSTATREGRVQDFDLSPRTADDRFWFTFDGFLNIRRGGAYVFQLGSDEGSRLYLNGNLVVGHDGLHTFSRKTSQPIHLDKGAHRIFVQYFEHEGDQRLEVSYRGPDTHEQMMPIPPEALNSGDPVSWDEVIALLEARRKSMDSAPTTGIESPGDVLRVHIYPNPARLGEPISVELGFTGPGVTTRIRLVDVNGRLLYDGYWSPGMSPEIAIPVNGQGLLHDRLHPGMYVVMVEMGDAVIRKKLIIRR